MAKKYTCCAVCVTYTCSADQFNTHLVSSVVKSTFISVLTNECYFSMDECPVFRGRNIKILKKKKNTRKEGKRKKIIILYVYIRIYIVYERMFIIKMRG